MNMRSKLIHINTAPIIAFLVISVFLQPSSFATLVPSVVMRILRLLQIGAFALIVMIFIYSNTEISAQLIFIFLYYVTVYGISLLIKSSTPQLVEVFSAIALCMYIACAYACCRKGFFAGFAAYYMLVALVEIVLILRIRPDPYLEGMVLFSNRNHVIRFFLPGAFFVLMDSKSRTDRYVSAQSILYFTMMVFLIAFGRSATGMVSLVIMMGLILLFRNRRVPKFMELKYVMIYSMLIFVGIYVFQIQQYFEHFIVSVLHRNVTFSGRTEIWDITIKVIRKNLLFGVGAYSHYDDFLKGHMHAHQYWLHNLLSGGLAGTTLIILVYIKASNGLRNASEVAGASILCAVLTAFLVIGLDEALTRTEMLIPLLFLAGIYGRGEIRRRKSGMLRVIHNRALIQKACEDIWIQKES